MSLRVETVYDPEMKVWEVRSLVHLSVRVSAETLKYDAYRILPNLHAERMGDSLREAADEIQRQAEAALKIILDKVQNREC